jgi:HEAT repeat protein
MKNPIRQDAVRELEFRNDSAALTALAEAANAGDQFLRRMAVEVIGRHSRGRELNGVVLKALQDTSGYVVRTACDVVARWNLPDAHNFVVALLMNTSASTRQSAIRALTILWVDADFRLIFDLYSKDSDIGVRREAAWVLRARASSENWRIIFDAFYADEPPRHRIWGCELAEAFQGIDVLPQLSRLSVDRDGHVRQAAARAVAMMSAPK